MRDGNQVQLESMNRECMLRLFQELARISFKEIEVGFPSASQTDFDIVSHLIDENLIPPDVISMVSPQLREDLIRRTVQSARGTRRIIVHFYNAIAPAWRKIVFNLTMQEIIALVRGQVTLLKMLTDTYPETEWVLQYSPETFCMAELDVSLQVCSAAIDAWNAGPGRPMIINLPTTVEVSTPNVLPTRSNGWTAACRGASTWYYRCIRTMIAARAWPAPNRPCWPGQDRSCEPGLWIQNYGAR